MRQRSARVPRASARQRAQALRKFRALALASRLLRAFGAHGTRDACAPLTCARSYLRVPLKACPLTHLSASELERIGISVLPCALRVVGRAAREFARREAVRRAEVVAPCHVYQARADFGRPSLEEADVGHSVEQVARLASLHLPVFEHVVVE